MRLALLIPLLLAACTASDEDGRLARSEAKLAAELDGRTAGEPQACVPARHGRSLVVRDKRTLVYEDGRTLWVNRLESVCPGLDPFGQLVVEVHGSRHCRGDLVRGIETGSSVPGPWCRLGQFTPWRRR